MEPADRYQLMRLLEEEYSKRQKPTIDVMAPPDPLSRLQPPKPTPVDGVPEWQLPNPRTVDSINRLPGKVADNFKTNTSNLASALYDMAFDESQVEKLNRRGGGKQPTIDEIATVAKEIQAKSAGKETAASRLTKINSLSDLDNVSGSVSIPRNLINEGGQKKGGSGPKKDERLPASILRPREMIPPGSEFADRAEAAQATIKSPMEMTDPELDELKKRLDKWQKKDVSGWSNADLTPFLALTDAWTGSNFSNQYRSSKAGQAIVSPEEKEQMIDQLKYKISSTKYQRKLQEQQAQQKAAKAQADRAYDLWKFQQQEQGKYNRQIMDIRGDLLKQRIKNESDGAKDVKDYVKGMKDVMTYYGGVASSGANFDSDYVDYRNKTFGSFFTRGVEDTANRLVKELKLSPADAVDLAVDAAVPMTERMAGLESPGQTKRKRVNADGVSEEYYDDYNLQEIKEEIFKNAVERYGATRRYGNS